MEINLNLPISYIILEFLVSSCLTLMTIKCFLKRTRMCSVVHETPLYGTEICALCSGKYSMETTIYQDILGFCVGPAAVTLGKLTSFNIPNHIMYT